MSDDSIRADGGLSLTSPAFDNGDPIPRQYGYEADNVNPPLHIEGVPDDAESLALVMDDPDAPGGTWVHWLVWNVAPDRTEIPEDWTPSRPAEGANSWDEVGYGGPNPPDKRHTYRFEVYALESTLDLARGADRDELDAAVAGSVLASARLTGTYAP
jgi:Raf kinase inhibitor-like YbhB/YbcL family protein